MDDIDKLIGPNRFINIEKLFNVEDAFNNFTHYKITLTLPFYTEQRNVLINEYTENASEVLIKLTISIQDLLKDLILKIGYNLERYKRETGSYDTTINFGTTTNRYSSIYLQEIERDLQGLSLNRATSRNDETVFSLWNTAIISHNNLTPIFTLPTLDSELKYKFINGSCLERIKQCRNSPKRKSMLLLCQKIGKKKFKMLKKKYYFEEEGKYGTYRFYNKPDYDLLPSTASTLNYTSGVSLHTNITIGPKIRPVVWVLCIQSTLPNLPIGDLILSRWLEFKVDEDNFIKTANFRKIDVTTQDEAIER